MFTEAAAIGVFLALPRNKPTLKLQLQTRPVPWLKPGLRPFRVGSAQLWATLTSQTKQPNISAVVRIFIVSLPKSGDFKSLRNHAVV